VVHKLVCHRAAAFGHCRWIVANVDSSVEDGRRRTRHHLATSPDATNEPSAVGRVAQMCAVCLLTTVDAVGCCRNLSSFFCIWFSGFGRFIDPIQIVAAFANVVRVIAFACALVEDEPAAATRINKEKIAKALHNARTVGRMTIEAVRLANAER